MSPAGGSAGGHPLGWTKLHQTARRPNRLDLPPDESANLEELEAFSKMFKQKRIKLGYTQASNNFKKLLVFRREGCGGLGFGVLNL